MKKKQSYTRFLINLWTRESFIIICPVRLLKLHVYNCLTYLLVLFSEDSFVLFIWSWGIIMKKNSETFSEKLDLHRNWKKVPCTLFSFHSSKAFRASLFMLYVNVNYQTIQETFICRIYSSSTFVHLIIFICFCFRRNIFSREDISIP